MRPHAPLFALAAGARADCEVVFVFEDRLHQVRDRLWPVAAVAIEENKDLGPAGDRCSRAPGAGPAVAALSLDYNSGPGGAGHRGRPVAAAAIDDDDLVDPVARHRRQDRADSPLLVEDRNNCGNARSPRFFGAQPVTPTLSPQPGRGSRPVRTLAPHQRGEGGARVSGRVRGAVLHRLQRTPQEAQAGGGVSVKSARRNS
jgi:hypothetical protein